MTAKLADMVLYDIPNVRLPWVQVDIYSTYRDETGVVAALHPVDDVPTARSPTTSTGTRWTPRRSCARSAADTLLDDRGNPLPIDADAATRDRRPGRVLRGRLRCCAF